MMDTIMTSDAGPSRPRGVATVVAAPLIDNLDRFGVQELERMRERQMKIVNRPRRVAAPPSDEAERKRARLKIESIELRLSALRTQDQPPDRTGDILDQMNLMSVGKPVQVELRVKSKLSMRPYGMAEPHSPTSPNGFRAAMSEEEAMQIQREAYALAHAKKESDAQRRALHEQATNTYGISEEEKRKRILAYMSFKGDSDEEDEDEDDMDEDDDGDDLFGEYEDGEGDMVADEYGFGGIIQVDANRYANYGD